MSTTIKNGMVRGGVVAGTNRKAIGSKLDAFYAAMVEFGTIKMDAKPYLRPAIDTRTPQALDVAAQYARERVEAGDLNK